MGGWVSGDGGARRNRRRAGWWQGARAPHTPSRTRPPARSCARSALESVESACPFCQAHLSRSNVKVVKPLRPDTRELAVGLAGQAPETVLAAAALAVQFCERHGGGALAARAAVRTP